MSSPEPDATISPFSAVAWRLKWHSLRYALAFGLLYLVAFLVVSHFALGEDHIIVFWPADGVFLGALVLAPVRRWPFLLLVGIAVEFAYAFLISNDPGARAVAWSFGNPLEALLGASLMRYFLRDAPDYVLSRRILVHLFFVVFVVGGLGAIHEVLAFMRVYDDLNFLEAWQTWWLSESLGLLFVTPVIIGWGSSGTTIHLPKGRQWLEAIAFVVGFSTAIWLAFWMRPAAHPLVFELPSICFPFLIWAAFRCEPKTVALILFMTAYCAISATDLGRGFFSVPGVEVQVKVLALQTMLVTMFVSAMFTSAALKDAELARAEKRRAEQLLEQADRLRLAGETASGVAHDFNNYLMVARGRAELLAAAESSGDTGKGVKKIIEALDRCSNLARRLQRLGKTQEERFEIIELGECVRNLKPLLSDAMGSAGSLDFELPESEPLRISGNSGELDELLLNLVVNARDAIAVGGTCCIAVESASLNPDNAPHYMNGRPGSYARLVVSDDGEGMDEETQRHLFDPFYTTKGEEGTGLGMAMVYGIAQKHRACIRVESAPGVGTTIAILFPKLVAR